MLDSLKRLMLYIIRDLDPQKLYTGQEAAKTKLSASDPDCRRMGQKIWRLINNRDLHLYPDNAMVDPRGMPLLDSNEGDAKICLIPGETSPRWLGRSIQAILNDEERKFLLVDRLANLLSKRTHALIDNENAKKRASEVLPPVPQKEEPVRDQKAMVEDDKPPNPLHQKKTYSLKQINYKGLPFIAIAVLCLLFLVLGLYKMAQTQPNEAPNTAIIDQRLDVFEVEQINDEVIVHSTKSSKDEYRKPLKKDWVVEERRKPPAFTNSFDPNIY